VLSKTGALQDRKYQSLAVLYRDRLGNVEQVLTELQLVSSQRRRKSVDDVLGKEKAVLGGF
jgi:hypothetical protein